MRRVPSLVRLLVGGGILAGVVLLAGFVVLGDCHLGGRLREQRLASCTSPTLQFTLRCPSPGGAQLLLGLPPRPAGPRPPPFRGEVVIRRGGHVALHFSIASWKTRTGNWLESRGLPETYFLTGGTVLGKALKQGETYDVTVTFAHPPPSTASLWLAWAD